MIIGGVEGVNWEEEMIGQQVYGFGIIKVLKCL
jgi:hypothetical protein